MSKYSHDVAWFSALTSSVQCREEASPTACCTSSVTEVLLLTSLPRPQLAKLSVRQTHLVPVQCRLVDLFHRAWLQSVNKSAKKKKEKKKKESELSRSVCILKTDDRGPGGLAWQNFDVGSAYSHRMTPFFRPFWKSGPMELPVMSSIQILSSSSFWGSYFCAI